MLSCMLTPCLPAHAGADPDSRHDEAVPWLAAVVYRYAQLACIAAHTSYWVLIAAVLHCRCVPDWRLCVCVCCRPSRSTVCTSAPPTRSRIASGARGWSPWSAMLLTQLMSTARAWHYHWVSRKAVQDVSSPAGSLCTVCFKFLSKGLHRLGTRV